MSDGIQNSQRVENTSERSIEGFSGKKSLKKRIKGKLTQSKKKC